MKTVTVTLSTHKMLRFLPINDDKLVGSVSHGKMRPEVSRKNNVTGRVHVILGPQCNWLMFTQPHLRYIGEIKYFLNVFF